MDNLQKDICTIQIKTKWVSKLIRAAAAATAEWVGWVGSTDFHSSSLGENEKQKNSNSKQTKYGKMTTTADICQHKSLQSLPKLHVSLYLSLVRCGQCGWNFLQEKFFEILLISSNQRFFVTFILFILFPAFPHLPQTTLALDAYANYINFHFANGYRSKDNVS